VSGRYAWVPTPEVVERANTTRFARAHGLDGHGGILARSLEDPEWFWDAVVQWLDLGFRTPYERVLDERDGPEWARWFVGGTLNMAWSCVGRHAEAHPERPALVAEHEDGAVATLTYAELAERVARVAGGLAAAGVEPGERVALVMPMTAEAVIAFHAIAWLGAIAVPVFSGFSSAAIASRLADAGVAAAVTADAGLRRGRAVPIAAAVDEALAAAPSVRRVVLQDRGLVPAPARAGLHVRWEDVAASAPVEPQWVPSEHPALIAYTSGTTGRPKGAVHVHGGFLVKIAQEAHFQADVHPGDRVSWITDMGWIMGPWTTVGTHANGGTLVVLEGAPDHPTPRRAFDFAARHRLDFLGVSPTLVRVLRSRAPATLGADLSALRAFGSTGEPWNREPYLWLFEQVGDRRAPIVNISGGTEVGACFLSTDVTVPMKPCSLGGPALGMAVDVWGPDGRPIREGVGELVCTRPWPGMTRGVWGDPERYLAAYWSRWPGVWVHGDWASVDGDGEWFLHGRSDDTLNVAGKRVGPAEYESALVGHPAVVEACAVGIPDATKGESVWCFVVLAGGAEPDDGLRAELAATVEQALGPAFRPAAVRFAATLPRTRSAKIVRRAVRAAALGEDAGDLSTLEDPAALDAVRSAL